MTNILVIDDDADICMLLTRFLSKNGFEVKTAFSGKVALESIASQVPDIILCDFRLEDTNGSDLLTKIKQNNPQVPVIIMTGYSDVRTAVNIMKLGAFDYVTKPLLPEDPDITIFKPFFQKRKIIEQTDTIIIDEVSMLTNEEKIKIIDFIFLVGKKQNLSLKFYFI